MEHNLLYLVNEKLREYSKLVIYYSDGNNKVALKPIEHHRPSLESFTKNIIDAMNTIEKLTTYKVRTFKYNYQNRHHATAIIIVDEPKPQPNVDKIHSHGPLG